MWDTPVLTYELDLGPHKSLSSGIAYHHCTLNIVPLPVRILPFRAVGLLNIRKNRWQLRLYRLSQPGVPRRQLPFRRPAEHVARRLLRRGGLQG